VVFSDAAQHANEGAGGGYFADWGGESLDTRLSGGARRIRNPRCRED
jgi:hypothetical protein